MATACKRRKPPRRTTKALGAWVTEDIRERAQRRAALLDVPLSRYISNLIIADTPLESAASAEVPALLGHRTVRALEALRVRIEAGEDCRKLAGELVALRREIAGVLAAVRPAYDAALDAAGDPPLDGRHT